MRTYAGAVLFIDILGISSLTTSTRPLIIPEDFASIGKSDIDGLSNQLFCAKLLSIFRENLGKCKVQGLNIAQLSDCAFIWSEDPNSVVNAGIRIFNKNVDRGIFARAGMSYGEIIEPVSTRTSLGRFICGEAVTRAVKLEQSGKGSRIFTDRHIGGKRLSKISSDAFTGITNISDFNVIDEFEWFSSFGHSEKSNKKLMRLRRMIDLIGMFRFCPKFRWNAASLQGQIHLGATIERLSIAVSSMVKDLDIKVPHFAVITSEEFRENFSLDQYCENRTISFSQNTHYWINEIKNEICLT